MSSQRDIKRVGILFSGGPAPAANAVISAAVMNFLDDDIEVLGFYEGFRFLEQYTPDKPLEEGKHFIRLKIDDVSGIRNRKAIIIRTARANPGKSVKTLDELSDPEKNAPLLASYQALASLEVDALVTIGGDDTLKTANFMYRIQEKIPGLRPLSVIHLPKTIDNDYYGIDWTFGFTSAANFAAREIRNLSADAKSTSAWYVLEIMGRKAGWLTYASGIAGEATRMLSVEDLDGGDLKLDDTAENLVDLMESREGKGKNYGIVCVAEGLADHLPEGFRPREVDKHGHTVLGNAQVGRLLADEMERRFASRTGRKVKVRSKQIGYETRCTEPVAFDTLLGCQLGVGAFRALAAECLSGVMVSVEKQLQLKYVPFSELIDEKTMKARVRFIEKDSDFYQLARALEYHIRQEAR